MTNYLLDTNICVFHLRGKLDLSTIISNNITVASFISEITVAELKYGLYKSGRVEENEQSINDFISKFVIIPIYPALDVYAKEKVRLQKLGTPIDDFDLLIGATAIANNFVLVTNNTKHFARLQGIQLEDWTKIDT